MGLQSPHEPFRLSLCSMRYSQSLCLCLTYLAPLSCLLLSLGITPSQIVCILSGFSVFVDHSQISCFSLLVPVAPFRTIKVTGTHKLLLTHQKTWSAAVFRPLANFSFRSIFTLEFLWLGRLHMYEPGMDQEHLTGVMDWQSSMRARHPLISLDISRCLSIAKIVSMPEESVFSFLVMFHLYVPLSQIFRSGCKPLLSTVAGNCQE